MHRTMSPDQKLLANEICEPLGEIPVCNYGWAGCGGFSLKTPTFIELVCLREATGGNFVLKEKRL